jgi:hypothetical protein
MALVEIGRAGKLVMYLHYSRGWEGCLGETVDHCAMGQQRAWKCGELEFIDMTLSAALPTSPFGEARARVRVL